MMEMAGNSFILLLWTAGCWRNPSVTRMMVYLSSRVDGDNLLCIEGKGTESRDIREESRDIREEPAHKQGLGGTGSFRAWLRSSAPDGEIWPSGPEENHQKDNEDNSCL